MFERPATPRFTWRAVVQRRGGGGTPPHRGRPGVRGLGDEHLDREPRIIACLVDTPVPVRVASVYVPHGRRRPLALRLQAGFPRRPGRAGPAVAARRCASARGGRRERGGVGRRRVPLDAFTGSVYVTPRCGMRSPGCSMPASSMSTSPGGGRGPGGSPGGTSASGMRAQPGYASRRHRGRSGAGGPAGHDVDRPRRAVAAAAVGSRCAGGRLPSHRGSNRRCRRITVTHLLDLRLGAGHLVTAEASSLSEFADVGDDRRQDAGAPHPQRAEAHPPAAVASTATASTARSGRRRRRWRRAARASAGHARGRTPRFETSARRLIGAAVERPNSAPRNAISSNSTVPSGIRMSAGPLGGRRRTRASSRSGCSAGPPMRRPAPATTAATAPPQRAPAPRRSRRSPRSPAESPLRRAAAVTAAVARFSGT